jgi:hypothetical protein
MCSWVADEQAAEEAANRVRRVLVIQDVGLWIDLNRHLSGVASVDLVEAVSFETGQLLAQIERPRIVVYGPNTEGPGAASLAQEFRAAGLSEIQVIAIDESAVESNARLPTRGSSGQPIVCSRDRLVGLVGELLALSGEESRPKIELLAHYELKGEQGEPTRGFAVICELSERSVAFESDVPLERGCELHLNFFLTEPSSESKRVKISLSCIVAQCRDEARLIYGARVSKLRDDARRALQRYALVGAGAQS